MARRRIESRHTFRLQAARVLSVLFAVLAASCDAPSRGPVNPSHTVSQVIDWALGPGERIQRSKPTPVVIIRTRAWQPTGGGIRLTAPSVTAQDGTVIVRDKGISKTRPTPVLWNPTRAYEPAVGEHQITERPVAAESFLPHPDGSFILLLSEGRISMVALADGRAGEPVALEGANPTLHVASLLAFAATPSPLRVLVAVDEPNGVDQTLKLLTLSGGSITAVDDASDLEAYEDESAFFGAFDVPRCKPSGRDCLVIQRAADRCHLDLEPRRGASPEFLQAYDDPVLLDAAWASPEKGTIYLLMEHGADR